MVQKRGYTIAGVSTLLAVGVYFVFRLFVLADSLADVVSLWDRVVVVLFWVAEMFILVHAVGYFLCILTAARSYMRPRLTYATDSSPMVAVLIPVHDEPLWVVRRTIAACRYMDYPSYTVTIVDASQRASNVKALRDLCREYGVRHFVVPSPRHGAKAGALNEAIKGIRAPYFVVFDADYRPSRDFLKVLVPQMEADETLGYIQTPQYYGNIVRSIVSRASELQQSIFFEFICEAKSERDAVFLCGTNFIMRTEALRSVGGFDETSITEDFSTSFRLLSSGWHSSYYNYTAAFGDGPLNLREYLRQQYRWARGTLGLFP